MSREIKPYYISKLIYKSVSQTITSIEKKELEGWLQIGNNRAFYAKIIQKEAIKQKELLLKNTNKEEVYKRIQEKIKQEEQPKLLRLKFYKIAKYAAVLLVFLTTGNLVYKSSFDEATITKNAIKNIKPGYEKATLILSDGTEVDLEKHKNEVIVSSKNSKIQNTNTGLVYNSTAINEAENQDNIPQPLKYNTLKVPFGGMYQVALPDGTKVWLNSGTSLKYPETFAGEQRLVELEGEAYFEVTKDSKEFIVRTNVADITVLGTHFNVSSYEDDSYFSSTLVEGKIKLATTNNINTNSSTILLPNQRGVINKNSSVIDVKTVDPNKYTAWKEGRFYFERERLDNILTRLSRWYDIDVVIENETLKNQTFTGVALKNKSVDHLLDMISKTTRVDYKITKNKVNDKYQLKLTRD